jgi:hypothetical protein
MYDTTPRFNVSPTTTVSKVILVNTCQETKSGQFQLASQCYTDKFYKETMTRCTNRNLTIQQNFAFTFIFQLLYHLSCASSMITVLWSTSKMNIILCLQARYSSTNYPKTHSSIVSDHIGTTNDQIIPPYLYDSPT